MDLKQKTNSLSSLSREVYILGLPILHELEITNFKCPRVHSLVMDTKLEKKAKDDNFTPDTAYLKDAAKEMGNIVMKKFSEVFKLQGCIKVKFDIHLCEDTVPKQVPPCKVPHSLRQEFKSHLEQLTDDEEILAKLEPNEVTPWTSSFVIVKKPKGIRVCIDPKCLNEAMIRLFISVNPCQIYVLPSANMKFMSKLDMKWGFWNLKLSQRSSDLTMINTTFGRYRWRRIPFRLACSGDLFQCKMDEMVHDISNVCATVDKALEKLCRTAEKEKHEIQCREMHLQSNKSAVLWNFVDTARNEA